MDYGIRGWNAGRYGDGKTVTTNQLAAQTGATLRQLQNWSELHLIHATRIKGSGATKGWVRDWSPEEARLVALLLRLRKARVPWAMCKRVIPAARKHKYFLPYLLVFAGGFWFLMSQKTIIEALLELPGGARLFEL